jgi:hypothetical protein
MLTAKHWEADMTGILDKFHVVGTAEGVRVVSRSLQLTSDCAEDGEIDDTIQMLKDDLDACGREMKRLIAINHRGALFEGWPSEKDDISDSGLRV